MGHFSCMESLTGQIDTKLMVDEVTKLYPIGSELISTKLYVNDNLNLILQYHVMEAA